MKQFNKFNNLTIGVFFWKKFNKKQRLYFQLALGAFLVVFIPIIIGSLQKAHKAQAAWFNDNWAYRKSIQVTNNTTAQTNVYIVLSGANALDTSDTTRFKSDCGDLRFTDQGGNLLSYYIVSGCGTTTTVVHVEFSMFPAGAQTIYYYYGNPSAADGFSASDFSTQASNYTIGTFGTETKAPAPIAYWKFDEGYGTTTADSTSNGNTATFAGTTPPSWQTNDLCVSGKCLYFDGVSSNLTVSKTINNVQTVAMWVRPVSVSSGALIDLDGGTHTITVSSGTISATGFTSPTIYVNGQISSTLTANRWQYVEVTTGTGFNTTSSLTIGKSGTTYYHGFMDEVKLFDYQRSSAQVLLDYNQFSTAGAGTSASLGQSPNNDYQALSNGLVGYWKMDESSWNGTTGEVKDSSGNGNNGTAEGSTGTSSGSNTTTTLNDTTKSWTSNVFANEEITITGGTDSGDIRTISSNTATQITVSTAWTTTPDATSTYRITPTTTTGKFGNGGNFDGTDDYIDIPNSSSVQNQAFTFSAWVKPVQNTDTIIGWASGGGPQFRINSIGELSILAENQLLIADSAKVISWGVWTHVAITYDQAGNYRFYINGADAGGSGNHPYTFSFSDLHIGNQYVGTTGEYFNGSIDEVRIYNRTLSSQDVQALYNFAPGPVGYWKFDEGQGSAVQDSSGYGNNGIWYGSGPKHWVPGKFGDAGNFNGTNDYVDVGNQTSLHTLVFTISAWIKIHTTGWYDDTIIGSKTDSNIWFSAGENRLRLQKQNLIDIASTNIGITPNTWNNVAVTYDSSGNYVFYINGVNVGSGTNLQTFPFSADILIGAQRNGGAETNGSIDDVRIYNYARTQQQIIEDMNGGHPTGGSPLGTQTGYWKFDEGYGTTAHDSTINADNGTLSGSTLPSWTNSGKFGKALSFDGSSSYVTLGSDVAPLKITGAMTLSAWINQSTTGGTRDIISKIGSSGNYSYDMFVDINGHVEFSISSDGTTTVGYTETAVTLAANKWYYIASVYDPTASTMTIYINGQQVGQKTSSVPSSIYNSTATVNIGAEDGGFTGFFEGTIDEVKVYAGALTADQIKIDYNHNSAQVLGALGTNTSYQPQAANQQYCVPGDTSSCASPILDWELEEGSGTTANDSSGNGNTGSISGGTWTIGKIGKGLKLNLGSSIDSGPRSSLDFTNSSFTLEEWFNLSSVPDPQSNILKENSGQYQLYLLQSDNKLRFGVIDSSGTTHTIISDNAIALNTWYHVSAVYNGSEMYMYIDGVKQSNTASVSLPLSTIYNGGYGDVWVFGTGSTQEATGTVDQVRIYNYARTPAQVAWDYDRGAPIAWWKFDECQGTTIHDSSGNGYNGTITLGAGGAYTAPGTCTDGLSTSEWYAGRNGKINSALALNDNNTAGSEYAKLTNDINMQGWTELTVSAWVNIQRNLQYDYIVNKSYNGDGGYGNTTYHLILYYDSPQFHIAPQGSWTGNSLTVTAPSVISLNTWHHLVGTWDNNTIKLYVDGVEVANGPALYGYLDNNQITTFGNISTNGNYFFDGLIDDVRIYNYALTATQVKTLYNNGAVNFAPVAGAP